MADATKIGVADATKMGVANARVAYLLPPLWGGVGVPRDLVIPGMVHGPLLEGGGGK